MKIISVQKYKNGYLIHAFKLLRLPPWITHSTLQIETHMKLLLQSFYETDNQLIRGLGMSYYSQIILYFNYYVE